MRTRYASAECIQLFNDIANIFAHNPNSIWNTVSGFAIFNEERTRQLLEIYVTLCDEDNDASYLNRKAMKNIMTISNLQNQMKIMITKV